MTRNKFFLPNQLLVQEIRPPFFFSNFVVRKFAAFSPQPLLTYSIYPKHRYLNQFVNPTTLARNSLLTIPNRQKTADLDDGIDCFLRLLVVGLGREGREEGVVGGRAREGRCIR